jgi:molecular chaperone GrpE (heat shock protein)
VNTTDDGPEVIAERWQALRGAMLTATQRMRELRDGQERLAEERIESERRLFLELIDIVDRVDAVLESAEPDEKTAPWAARLETMSRLLKKTLARRQVTPIDLLTAPPGLATVIDRVVTPGIDREKIIEVVQRGWLWKGEVLRNAAVIVAVPPDYVVDDTKTEAPPYAGDAGLQPELEKGG